MNNFLLTIFFTKDNIANAIKIFDPYRSHGRDMISIFGLKTYGELIHSNHALRVENYTSIIKETHFALVVKNEKQLIFHTKANNISSNIHVFH